VAEYIILDRRPQRGELIDEVIGYRLEEKSYVPITPDEEGRIGCPTIGVKVGLVEGQVKLWEAETGEPLLSSQEIEEQARQEAQRAEQAELLAQQEAQRAQQEAQRAEQAELLAQQEAQRAEQAELLAQQEAQRAEQERQARQEAIPRLLALGLSLEQIAQALGLSVAEVQRNRD
jgi:DNA-binding CsgD family transcriptional regulator